MNTRNLYLELIKKSITDKIYPVKNSTYKHQHGWPQYAHTMVSEPRLDNAQYCVEKVLEENIPGDIIETGVWRGGTSILMKAVLKAYGVIHKKSYVADSFQGLPKPDSQSYPKDSGDDNWTWKELAISLEEVRANFEKYDLLDENVVFVKGWFRDTLPNLNVERFSVIRLDGDMYESTWVALESLYPKLSVGGYCIIDDYELLRARYAMEDYRKLHKITDELHIVDCSVYWKKT